MYFLKRTEHTQLFKPGKLTHSEEDLLSSYVCQPVIANILLDYLQ